jgi:hypothetical protein
MSKERRWRAGERSAPVAPALEYGIEIAEALDKAHQHGIAPISPGNVMLTKGGVKLLDFGGQPWRCADA